MSIDIDLGIVHHFSSGVYARQMKIPSGHFAVSHAHRYDHLSILSLGCASVEVDGVKRVYHAPACLTVEAGKHHRIEAITDVVWFCIHATDALDAEHIDEVLIKG